MRRREARKQINFRPDQETYERLEREAYPLTISGYLRRREEAETQRLKATNRDK